MIARRAAGDLGELALPKRSEILRGWALPVMAEALAADEDERAAFEMLNSVKNLNRRETPPERPANAEPPSPERPASAEPPSPERPVSAAQARAESPKK